MEINELLLWVVFLWDSFAFRSQVSGSRSTSDLSDSLLCGTEIVASISD